MSTTDPSAAKFDVYRAITDKIVQAIEAGAGKFVMPWHTCGAPVGRPTNAATGTPYRGVNVVGLWAEAMLSGYASGTWATFRQWQKLGANVRRGEGGTPIVFYKKREVDDRRNDEEERTRYGPRLIARASWVFNASQVAGWKAAEPEGADPACVLERVESFVAATKAQVRYGGDIACYRVRDDVIEMPARNRFVGSATSSATEAHYATLLHELTHWTGAAHRLSREFGAQFKANAYAFEELVAELGAAFLCGDLAIANEPRPDHAAYLANWLAVLKENRRAIFTAAKLASAATEYLGNLSRTQ